MNKEETQPKMTVVYLAHGASKPVAPFTNRQMENEKVLDPSSCFRTERYPIPLSFEYRFDSQEREYV